MKYIFKLFLILKFISIFAVQMCIANFRVAYYIVIPGAVAKPGVIAYPLDYDTDVQLTLLAIIISLTPGTLALDISSDKKYLYLHTIFIGKKEKIINEIKQQIELPIKRILSWNG